MKRLFITAILALSAFVSSAQHVRANLEYDYNRTEKSRINSVVAADFQLADNLHLDLGLMAGSQSRCALNVAYQLDLVKRENSTLFLENRYLYRLFSTYNLQEFNAMLNLGYRNIHWIFKFGLCNRYIAEIPLRKDGGEGTVFEPMNVSFDIEYNLFPEDHPWNIGCGISNYREFIIERFTLFYYTLHGYYSLNERWRLTGETGLHPCGVLNLSSQYNGFFFNLGCTFKY
ncbi:MAG: hypothetical protein J6P73_07305 [Bacteroidales bacterium]|nr:hypothetical protein [Bacteroidales bacterium]